MSSARVVVAPNVVGMLGVAFVILKLCGIIDWSWWWVTLPFWAGFALIAGILIAAFSISLIGDICSQVGQGIVSLVDKITKK